MINKPISVPLLPSTGYSGSLIPLFVILQKCLFTTKYILVIPLKITFTENCSNDEENSALHHRNNITFYNILKLKTFFIYLIIFHNIAVF